MAKWLSLIAAVNVAACGGSVAAPSPSPSVIQHAALSFNGLARSYTVFRPSSLDPKQLVPLLVAMHPYTANAAWMETQTHFDEQAKQQGFIVVYPQGVNNSWNAGRCCDNNNDDVGFIRELVDRLVRNSHVDPKRVFATGMSNGGMMAQRLACELSDKVAAVASVSGALAVEACSPARPISVLEMHGTADPIVPFEGSTSTISFMTRWGTIDGCAASPTVTESGITKTSTWSGCREGTVVVLHAVTGGKHSWFGPDGPLPGEPNATEVVWNFFSHLPARA